MTYLISILPLAIFLTAYGVASCSNESGKEYGHDLLIYTDDLTGCQYLSRTGNGITPRMGVDGKQICKEVTK